MKIGKFMKNALSLSGTPYPLGTSRACGPFQELVVHLERKPSASQVKFKPLDTPHNR